MRFLAVLIPVILSTIYLLANQLAQPPESLKPKIFVIGLSRTGTTSIGNALALLGYKRLGWKDIRSRHLVHSYIRGYPDPINEQTKYFDAFEDLPWPFLYREMAEMYPDAKFILSLRKDEKTWLRSMRRHLGRGHWRPATFFYGAHVVDGNEETLLNAYRNHTADVREYFKDQPGRYSELVIEDGDANWRTLCSIAQCPEGRVPALDFPKSNSAEDWDYNILRNVHWLWSWTVMSIEEISTNLYYQQNWPVVNSALERMWQVVSTLELASSNMYFKLATRIRKPLPLLHGEVPVRRGRDD